ncbi:serine/arginine repetitive matrix protein 2 isoform X2 [Nilaparvata lugens]|nr:serine/arginine repetitive matrix protein 2 isoform X2 [Nilaparvata lugens]
MAIKIKQEPIPLDEDEEDEEALRLAVLQSLKAKQASKPAAPALPPQAAPPHPACRPPSLRGHPPPYRSAPPYRPFRGRGPFPPFAALGSRGMPTGIGFQRHKMNPNLIAIVPVSEDQPPKSIQEFSRQNHGQRFQDRKSRGRGHPPFSRQMNVPNPVHTTVAESTSVPSKFSRIDASDSESDDDLLTKKKHGSEDEADDDPLTTKKNESEGEADDKLVTKTGKSEDGADTKDESESDDSSVSEDDDSLEKLMEEMEQEMSAEKTSKPKKPKKLKEKKKKVVPEVSKQIPADVIEQKVLNIKKEKEDVQKVDQKPVVKAAPENVQEPVKVKPVVGIAKPTCIDPLKVKIKQEPIDSDDVKGSIVNPPKNNILEKVTESSSLSPIRIRSPNEVNSRIESKSTSSNVDESKEKRPPPKATGSQDKKSSPTKSTCSSPVEFIERSPVSPIMVDSPKSDKTNLLDENELSQDKERAHPPRKQTVDEYFTHSPDRRDARKFSRSPSPRTYSTRHSPGKRSFYHDSASGVKSNGRTSPFDRYPKINRAPGERPYAPLASSRYSPPYGASYRQYSPTYGPISPSYSPFDSDNTYKSSQGQIYSHFNNHSTSERSRSPFHSLKNHPNSSSHYNDEQKARYREGESAENFHVRPRYPPLAVRRSRSPRRLSRSPRRWSRSPRRLSRSPRRVSRSPRRLSRSPRRLSRSPRRLNRSPGLHSRSPSPKSRSPKRYIPRPSRRRSPWNSRIPNQFPTARRCVSRSPTPHQTRDGIRRRSTSPGKVQYESRLSPGERQVAPQPREPLSPRKPRSRSPVPSSKVPSPSRARRASLSPSRREPSPNQRYSQRSLSPGRTHPESRHRQSSLSPKRRDPTHQKDQARRYSPGRRRQMPPQRGRYNHPNNKSRSPLRKTSPLQTQHKNAADRRQQNWDADPRRAGQAPTTKSLSPSDASRQRSRSPLRDGSDLKSRRRSPPQNSLRRQAGRRRGDVVDRNRDHDRRDRRRDNDRERAHDRSREKPRTEHDKKDKDDEKLETGTAKTDQEQVEDKEPVISDPVMEARRRKFESNDLVQPVSKKICLKSKNKTTDSPDVTQDEEVATEEKLLAGEDGEESDEMLDLDRYDKAYCTTDDVLDLGADNLLWEDDPPDWNRKIEVSVNKPAKRSKEKVKDLRSKVTEKKRHKHKAVEASPVKRKKKKRETTVTVDNEPSRAEEDQAEASDNQLQQFNDKEEEPHMRNEEVEESGSKDLETANDDCDLRAELSRRRAERLTKAGSLHDSLPKRLLQSAFKGLIGKSRTETKGSKSKESKHTKAVEPKVQPLAPNAEVAYEPGKRRVAEVPSEAGKRRVLLLKRNKPTRKASFQIGLKVTKESDSDSLPSYSEEESEENQGDDSVDQSESESEDVAQLLAAVNRKQDGARVPVKSRLGSAINRGQKQKRKFFRRNQV